jgi:hypothetical protein
MSFGTAPYLNARCQSVSLPSTRQPLSFSSVIDPYLMVMMINERTSQRLIDLIVQRSPLIDRNFQSAITRRKGRREGSRYPITKSENPTFYHASFPKPQRAPTQGTNCALPTFAQLKLEMLFVSRVASIACPPKNLMLRLHISYQ